MLKQILLTRKIADATKLLEALDFGSVEQRKAALATRESELADALNQVDENTSEEDKTLLEQEVTEHEALKQEIAEAEAALENERVKLNDEIEKLQKELDEINQKPSGAGAEEARTAERKEGIRTMDKTNTRMKFFGGISLEQRSAVMEQQSVKDFLQRVRAMKGQTRAVTGAELGIPEVLLGILRDNLHIYSKLVSKVRLVRVPGKARQTIAGTIPEAVWTEACANLNELAINFNQVEVDGYKVGGYIPVCNALLEDTDINLTDEIMHMIGQGVGFAVDKAVIYGTGVKMPVGIVTRLAQASAPSSWGENAPAWTNLATSNVRTLNPGTLTPTEFYALLVGALGIPKANFVTSGSKFWAMNSTTLAAVQKLKDGQSSSLSSSPTMTSLAAMASCTCWRNALVHSLPCPSMSASLRTRPYLRVRPGMMVCPSLVRASCS